ncbi:hypothetical protein [Echinicola shivajiensis]|uniref:hypothetical protein n=1 Tax=Echinicola shivajiensis TaxID=1035916 RepID=UPI001BFC15E4|nr:hypothetical protein [Echinicola shivajiensis]
MDNLKFLSKSQLISFLLLLGIFFTRNTLAQYSLEKVDEFQINSLWPVEIIDHYPKDGLYLGYIHKRSEGTEIAILNEKGEILISKNMQGDAPDKYTTSLNCLGFSENGDIWALTATELLLYDQKLVLQKRQPYKSSVKIHLYSSLRPFAHFYKNNDPSSLYFISNPSGVSKYMGKRDFRSTNLIEISNEQESNSYEIAPVAERALYKSLDPSINDVYSPIYTLQGKNNPKLYLTTSLDNEITVLDINTGEVISRVKINHDEFKVLESQSISLDNMPSNGRITLSAFNRNLFKLDGELMALEYVKDISLGIYEKNKAEDPNYHHFKDPNYHKIILLDEHKQLSKDLSIPYGKIAMALPGNRLLIRLINPDEEEDFIQYGIYQITESDNN